MRCPVLSGTYIPRVLEPAGVTDLKSAGPVADGTRARRTIAFFLIVLALLVFARLARSAENAPDTRAGSAPASGSAAPRGQLAPPGSPAGVSLTLENDLRLLIAGRPLNRTIVIGGLRPGRSGYSLDWEAVQSGRKIAGGRHPLTVSRGTATRIVVTVPIPSLTHPAGVDLRLEVLEGGQSIGGTVIPFTVYPEDVGLAIAGRLADAHVAIYDPEKKATPLLRSLGMRLEEFGEPEGLALYEGDLVVVGPGGFARGREQLGPVLAARAGAGMNVLVLDQPTIPGTLSDDLRLWPAFGRSGDTTTLLTATHPLLAGLAPEEIVSYFAGSGSPPLVPPSRGNFRVIAQTVVRNGPQSQEGVRALEIDLGGGIGLFIQAPICADTPHDPRARILLVNSLASLLTARPPASEALFYGRSTDDLPACIARLRPRATRAGPDLRGDGVLMVPADWRAPMLVAGASLPARAEVARFLRDGGTVILLQPQPQADRYIATLTGAIPAFGVPAPVLAGFGAAPQPHTPQRPAGPQSAGPADRAGHPTLLDGIDPGDLAMLLHPDDRDFTLRTAPGGVAVDSLIDLPGLALYRVGRGTLVALALPGADACAAPRASSLLARLLTNLGVPLESPPLATPATVSLLD